MTMVLSSFDISSEYAHSGMIDWLTLKICLTKLPDWLVYRLQSLSSKLFKVNALTGVIDWETYCFETVRSDTHQICFKIGGELSIQGSPARIGLPNNAFGSADIRYCSQKMISFAEHYFSNYQLPEDLSRTPKSQPAIRDVNLPALEHWDCSRVDITRNYLMQSGAEARQAMAYLKQTPESRQKHSYESNGLYIGKRSTKKRGKIYLKGQDAKRNKQMGRAEYTDVQILKSQRILRAELTLARHELRRLREEKNLHWYRLTVDYLLNLHDEYFKDYFSEIEVTDMSNVLERLLKVAPTEGQARAAYDCYVRIRMTGFEQAKETYTKTSWYRHIANLKAANFKRADLQMINVIPLQKRAIAYSAETDHPYRLNVIT